MNSSSSPELRTAVLFLVFNRPDTSKLVFETIRKARPPRLYVAADGSRKDPEDEAERVAEVRRIATNIDWPCEITTLFRETNLGCKEAVSTAIDWFFKHEEQGIILEDDCLPQECFFRFSESLLEKYKIEKRVIAITGNNFQRGRIRGDASYYFSKYAHCWGWATWARSWQHYQGDIPFWGNWKITEDWHRKVPNKVERRYWENIFDGVADGKFDSWAYPWLACVWRQGGLTATPNVNLVSNIGFAADATHTTSRDSTLAGMSTHPLKSIQHPDKVEHDLRADRFVFDHVFGGRSQRPPHRIISSLRRMKRAFS